MALLMMTKRNILIYSGPRRDASAPLCVAAGASMADTYSTTDDDDDDDDGNGDGVFIFIIIIYSSRSRVA